MIPRNAPFFLCRICDEPESYPVYASHPQMAASMVGREIYRRTGRDPTGLICIVNDCSRDVGAYTIRMNTEPAFYAVRFRKETP